MESQNGDAPIANLFKISQISALVEQIRPLVGNILSPSLDTMGESSLFNLLTGLMALRLTGVGGKLIVQIPTRPNGRVEVDWQPQRNTNDG